MQRRQRRNDKKHLILTIKYIVTFFSGRCVWKQCFLYQWNLIFFSVVKPFYYVLVKETLFFFKKIILLFMEQGNFFKPNVNNEHSGLQLKLINITHKILLTRLKFITQGSFTQFILINMKFIFALIIELTNTKNRHRNANSGCYN